MATKRKKRLKRKFVLFLFIVLLILIGYFTFSFINNNRSKLKKLGYNEADISLIFNKTSKSDIKVLTKENYDKYYIELINNSNYTRDNMDEYVFYYNEYKDATTNDVIYLMNNNIDLPYNKTLSELINNDQFKVEKINDYVKYSEDNKKADAESIILIVNNNIDEPYSNSLVNIIKDKYFLINRLDRYLNYSDKYTTKSGKDIVANVNSNLDYDFYTNVKDVDLSKGNLLLVNKFNKLTSTYKSSNLVPMDSKYTFSSAELDKTAYDAFVKLANDAAKEGLIVKNKSAYRSFDTQNSIYTNYKSTNGLAWADSYSARPGYSEHQTGLSLDVGASGENDLGAFEYTDEFTWMKDNAHKYGFILRYPEGKEYLTGYNYEPWHYRYVGVEVATKIYELDITYEEYYAYFIDKK
ncbi:MAG: D-alanyl-D-alanine carboxypeptidase family protein [Ignavibacteriales bacterium]